MALYHGGENDNKFVSSSLKNPSPTLKDVDLEEVLMEEVLKPLSQIWLLSKGFAWCALGDWLGEHKHFSTWLLQVWVKSFDEIDKICEERQH